jgi:hypothetical protein
VSEYKVIGIDEIPARDNWIPIRDQLGIGAFGVNAYRGDEAGSSVISDHTELMARHEELYVVVEGHATFTVDGQEVDAPAGTLVFVSDPATRRGAVAKEPGTTVLVAGAKPGEAFEISPWEEVWEENREAMALYREEPTRTPRPCSARHSTSIRTLRGSSTTSPASRPWPEATRRPSPSTSAARSSSTPASATSRARTPTSSRSRTTRRSRR